MEVDSPEPDVSPTPAAQEPDAAELERLYPELYRQAAGLLRWFRLDDDPSAPVHAAVEQLYLGRCPLHVSLREFLWNAMRNYTRHAAKARGRYHLLGDDVPVIAAASSEENPELRLYEEIFDRVQAIAIEKSADPVFYLLEAIRGSGTGDRREVIAKRAGLSIPDYERAKKRLQTFMRQALKERGLPDPRGAA